MSRVLGLTILILLAAPAPARPAEWPPGQTAMTDPSENATLGVSGRSAVADPLGRIHLVYQRNLEGEVFQIFTTVRETNGVWSPPLFLSDPGLSARNAAVTVDRDGRVHVFWEDLSALDGDIAHRVRDLDGTWGPAEKIAPSAGFSRHPVAAVDLANRVHVVWVDGRSVPQRILHAVLPPGGAWSNPDLLSPGGDIPQSPSISADAVGDVHAVWIDRVFAGGDRPAWGINYVRVGLVPGTPPAPVRVVDPTGVAVNPFVEALVDGTVYLVWLDSRTSPRGDYFEIYLKRLLPGIGWGKDKRFSYDGTDHGNPVIVTGVAGSLNVAWEDYRTGNPDIFYRQITPETGWDRNPTALTSDLSSSQAPSMVALPDGRLFVFWTDAQGTGVFRVFTKEGYAGSAP